MRPIKAKIKQSPEAGFTLVELMVTTGLFSILALMLSTFVYTFTKKISEQDRWLKDWGKIDQFIDRFDATVPQTLHLENTTQARCNRNPSGELEPAINCVTNPTDCGNGSMNPSESTPSALLEFIAETEINDASIITPASCYPFTAPNPTADGPHRGCPQRFRLVFSFPDTPPPEITIPTASLYIQRLNSNNSWTSLARLNDISEIRCGFETASINNSKSSRSRFSLKLTAFLDKLRKRNIELDAQFQNISEFPIHLGPTISERSCARDGTHSNGHICCSGYFIDSQDLCISARECLVSGTPISSGPSAEYQCCSRRSEGGSCL